MAYGGFTVPGVLEKFGLTLDTSQDLFAATAPTAISAATAENLALYAPLALSVSSEKARSEWLISPLLGQVWPRSGRTVYVASGLDFDVDPEAGLTGTSDFLMGRGPLMPYVTAPVLVVVEAKRDLIANGLGQCAATMVAARIANQRANTGVETIHGLVTTGTSWKFMRLRDRTLWLDVPEYQLAQADRILGILLECVGVAPAPASAA